MSQRFPPGSEGAPLTNNQDDILDTSWAFEESLQQLGNWRERIVHILLVSTSIIGLFAVVAETIIVFPDRNWGVLGIIVAAYLVVAALAIFRRIPYRIRATAFVIIFYLVGLFDLSMSGLAGDGRVFMLAAPLLTLVLLGQIPGLVMGVISLVSIAVIGLLMSNGILPISFDTSSTDLAGWISGTAVFILIGAAVFTPTNYMLNQLIVTLSGALEDARRRWLEVRQLSRNLERQVAERTKELARRSEKLEAAVEVSREVASIRQIDEILNTTVRLISERFTFYHAGIFLLDESKTFAILRAVSSEGGRRMLGRGHKLGVGKEGIVGHVTATGRPRIALDVGEDAAFFDNPDLPYTRSEMALPLQIRDEVIGALDVQSTQESAFSEEDIAILQTMADQISLAIENAQLLEQSERALRGLEAAYGEYTGSALAAMVGLPAFEYDRVTVMPAQPQPNPDVDQAIERGQSITSINPDQGQSALVAPLRTQDERVIGAIALEERRLDRSWSQEEIELVEAVGEQVAQALESASFYQMEQRRRRVSDTLREITRVVGSTLDLNEVIDRLLDELETLINFETASVQLIQENRREMIGGRGFDLATAQQHADLLRPVSEDPLISEAVITKQPVVIADVLADPRWEAKEETTHVRSWLAAPLVIGEEVIGLLITYDARPGMYDQETGELVSAVAAQAAIAVQNARLYNESQQRAQEQQGLARIAALVGSSLELDELIDNVMREVRELVGAETCAIMLGDEENNALVARYISSGDVTVASPGSWVIPMDSPGFEYSIFARGGAFYSNLGLEDPNLIPAYLPYMQELKVRNFCGVAVRVRERSVGEMYLVNRDGGFRPHEAQLLRTVASYIGNAIENTRLFQETQQRVDELAMLFRASEALAGAPLRADQIAEITIRQFVEVMGVPEASVSLLDPETGILHVLTDMYKDENEIKYESLDSFRLEDFPATAQVMKTQRPLVVQRSDPDADPAELAYMEEYNVQTLVIIPLAAKGESIGVIELETWEHEQKYTADQLNLAMTMANQVAVALENARLFEETRQRAERERLISEITGKIRASTNLDTIIQTTAQELGRALGTARVLVRVGIDPDDQSSTSE
jgi:GAF domain-containing protein